MHRQVTLKNLFPNRLQIFYNSGTKKYAHKSKIRSKKILGAVIMKVLLTGATGFIGSYVLSLLIRKDYKVNVIVRNPSKLNLTSNPYLNVFKGDITRPDDVKKAIDGCETVIHLAALVQSTAKNPEEFN